MLTPAELAKIRYRAEHNKSMRVRSVLRLLDEIDRLRSIPSPSINCIGLYDDKNNLLFSAPLDERDGVWYNVKDVVFHVG